MNATKNERCGTLPAWTWTLKHQESHHEWFRWQRSAAQRKVWNLDETNERGDAAFCSLSLSLLLRFTLGLISLTIGVLRL